VFEREAAVKISSNFTPDKAFTPDSPSLHHRRSTFMEDHFGGVPCCLLIAMTPAGA
jgi:hypothetical protein